MRELIVIAFEVVGLVAVAVGIGLAIAAVSTAAGVAAAGLSLIGEAALLEWRAHRASAEEPTS